MFPRTPSTRNPALHRISRRVLAWGCVYLLGLVGTGCAIHHEQSGLLEASGDRVELRTPEGRTFRLLLGEPSRVLKRLDGSGVTLDGPRVGRWVFVRHWQVTDGGDGSVPFIGLLRQHGNNLVLDDLNSGMPVVIDILSIPELGPYAGRMVLVMGFVVGAQEVRVVAYRVLSD